MTALPVVAARNVAIFRDHFTAYVDMIRAVTDLATAEDMRRAAAAWEEFHAGRLVEVNLGRRLRLEASVRIGELLGPRQQGARTDLSDATDKSIPRQRVAEFRLLAEQRATVLPDDLDAVIPPVRTSISLARRVRREHTPAMPDPDVADLDGLLHGDFRERLTNLPDGSVDLILTDPPYPKEDLALYSDLAKLAARVLGPRGLCIAYAGNMFLPEVLARMGEHLTYGWAIHLGLDDGQQSRILGRHFIQAWKPVVVFSTGTWPSGEWRQDTVKSPAPMKDDYRWQQNTAPLVELIESFCPPDGLVVDPFMGVGSTGWAAKHTGRRFVGIELNAAQVPTARGGHWHASTISRVLDSVDLDAETAGLAA